MAITQYKSFPFTSGVNYKKFDFLYDTGYKRYYYATRDNINQNPYAEYYYPVSSFSRVNEISTIYCAATGSAPQLTQGSQIISIGLSDSSFCYTGMVIDAGSDHVTYVNPGFDTGSSVTGGYVIATTNPNWTTGFFFVPSYSTSYEVKTAILESKFGDGYSQRQRAGINSNKNSINAVFENRTDKETKALLNFVQDKGGVEPFRILQPIVTLANDSTQKFVALDPKVATISYDNNGVSLVLTQVFDP